MKEREHGACPRFPVLSEHRCSGAGAPARRGLRCPGCPGRELPGRGRLRAKLAAPAQPQICPLPLGRSRERPFRLKPPPFALPSLPFFSSPPRPAPSDRPSGWTWRSVALSGDRGAAFQVPVVAFPLSQALWGPVPTLNLDLVRSGGSACGLALRWGVRETPVPSASCPACS